MNNYIDIINSNLKSYSKSLEFNTEFKEIFDYSVLDGGKRIRPVLALVSYNMFNDNLDEVMPFALAIELIHSYSLIHDDLPSMDNDDYRRGKESVHKKYGQAMAILAGDGLLNLAFELMSEDIKNSKDYFIMNKIRAMTYISQMSGTRGMIYGQIDDIKDNRDISEDDIISIYKRKTGGLFKAAIITGPLVAGANQEIVDIFEDFAEDFGLAFQVFDDILDKKQDEEAGKISLVTVAGEELALEYGRKYYNSALNSIERMKNTFHLDTSEFEKILGRLSSLGGNNG